MRQLWMACGERHHLIRPGITIAAQGREVADLMFYEDLRDVVLVGTSTGGLVICKIAELARERISRVVFVDALAPQPGERVSEIVQRDPNTPPMPTTDLTRGPTREEMENRLFADLEPELRAWAVERGTMHPVEASDAPGELDAFWAQSWDARVVRCRLSANPPEAHQRRTAEKLNADWHEMERRALPDVKPSRGTSVALGIEAVAGCREFIAEFWPDLRVFRLSRFV